MTSNNKPIRFRDDGKPRCEQKCVDQSFTARGAAYFQCSRIATWITPDGRRYCGHADHKPSDGRRMTRMDWYYSNCQQPRVFTRGHGTMDLNGGPIVESDHLTVHVEACGVPLFSDDARKSGVCSSCEKEWRSPPGDGKLSPAMFSFPVRAHYQHAAGAVAILVAEQDAPMIPAMNLCADGRVMAGQAQAPQGFVWLLMDMAHTINANGRMN